MRVVLASLLLMLTQNRSQVSLLELKTTAERTNYVETSRYAEVVHFLDVVASSSGIVHLASFGYSLERRALPLAVVGRVPDARPETVRATRRLRVYIQANVHAGEVEGKESAQSLIRDLALGAHAEWLDSMVLLVAPIYNADGNERVSLTNRPEQHGPIAGVGTRANAQSLNINRDHIKLETPEARSMVKLLNEFDPHVMIDLHTTNGTHHAYHLTYEVPNNPAVDTSIARMARYDWMPALTQAIKSKDGWDLRFYGNAEGAGAERVWSTVEDLPRYSHNYWGLRNRFGILSETYSYLTFQDRVRTVTRFLEETLAFAHSNAARIVKAVEDADAQSIIGQRLSLRSKLARSAQKTEILMGATEDDINPYTGLAMQKRIDVRTPELMWEEAVFESTETERVPAAYYVSANLSAVVERLRTHGIRMERLQQATTLQLEEFQIEASESAPQPFENHRERTMRGRYAPVERRVPAGAYRVPMNQPLARLAFYLLEPRSNDSWLPGTSWTLHSKVPKHSPSSERATSR